MGLSIEVGYLTDMLENDEEGAQWFREEMSKLERFLPSVGLKPHVEPEDCPVFSVDMWGYSGLHYLRRVAAHLNLLGTLPSPGDANAANDPVLRRYGALWSSPQPSLIGRLLGGKTVVREYDHLIFHSDAEGYYLPQDFEQVLIPPGSLEIPGGMIGSSQQLKKEMEKLAQALGLPLDLDPECEEILEESESQGMGEVTWKRYGIESDTCLRLYRAALHSIEHSAAIVFT